MATVTAYTKAAVDTALAAKADLVGGKIPDSQAPAISVKHGDLMVNVKDSAYGATGNGTTPDDAAVLAAIAAAGPGGVIYFPPGLYLLNGSTTLTLANAGTVLRGATPKSSKILLGSAFSGAAAITITADDCGVESLAIFGNSTTTTSNPVADAIYITGAKRARVVNCQFRFINSWTIEAVSNTSGAFPDGLVISRVYGQTSAGGIHLLGDNSSASAFNAFLDGVEFSTIGVTTGGGANLDAFRIEDAQDILVSNMLLNVSAGTGSNVHIKGNSVDVFFSNLDTNGLPGGGANVLIEDGTNGSPRNIQFDGGVIQKGSIGLRTTGGVSHLFVRSMRVLDCSTHGVSIESTNRPVRLSDINFSTNGAGAAGTNYDINWSGSAAGHVKDCRFGSNIVSTGTAGVQNSVNVGAGQAVRFLNAEFAGTGALSTNWFTNLPSAVLETSSGSINYPTTVQLTGGANMNSALVGQPSASGNTVLASNTAGTAAFDLFRLTGDGNIAIGPGTAARDTTWGRQGTAAIGTADSDIVIGAVGKGLRVKEGTNARQGTATLSAGTVTISNQSITANTRIYLGCKTPGGTVGALFVSASTIGSGFTVKSTSSTDTSLISYLLVEAA